MVIVIDLNGNDDEVTDKVDSKAEALKEEQRRADWYAWVQRHREVVTQIIPVE